jgi:Ni,Fe-hydrogenase maturation factor
MDPHAPALVDAILSAELFGVAPAEVLLVGIKAESFETGCSLTAIVNASLDQVIGIVLAELDQFHVQYRLRENPGEVGIWWTTVEALDSALAR